MRYLLYSCLLLTACSSDYQALQSVPANDACAQRMMPRFTGKAWYTTSVDVVGKHISGLLLIKQMPDSAYRIVFTNEAGVTFFDFEFALDGNFQKHHIIQALDRKPVVATLQKDFELLLGLPFRQRALQQWRTKSNWYIGFRGKDENIFYYTDENCGQLRGMERGSKRKRVAVLHWQGPASGMPEQVAIEHHNFRMTILLKKIERS